MVERIDELGMHRYRPPMPNYLITMTSDPPPTAEQIRQAGAIWHQVTVPEAAPVRRLGQGERGAMGEPTEVWEITF